MKRKAYELTEAEIRFIEGLRQGRLVLPGGENWVKLSPREDEAISMCRRIEFGPVTFRLKNGEPVEMEATVHARLGQNDEGRVSLVKDLRSSG